MTFQNPSNPSQTDFQVTSGLFEWADRTRTEFPRYENLGITYDGGTGVFTIRGAEADLSTSNPGYVTLFLDSGFANYRRFRITSNFSFQDANGTSDIIGNLFGLTSGRAHANTIPFFIYAVINDAEDTIQFAISRAPNTRLSPSVANSGSPASATADIMGAFFYLNSVTLGDYDGNSCVNLGGFQMTMDASDDWTVNALTVSDGFGKYFEATGFTMSPGHYGADAGNYFAANGGTAPIFNFADTIYKINAQRNLFELYFAFLNCTTAGVGAVLLTMAVPYPFDAVSTRTLVIGTGRRVGNTGVNVLLMPLMIAGNTTLVFRNINDTINATVNNADIGPAPGPNVEFMVSGSFPIDPTL